MGTVAKKDKNIREKGTNFRGRHKIKIGTKITTTKTLKQKQGVEVVQEEENDTFIRYN